MTKSDEELMRAYQAGDYQAFESLYARNSAKVYGYLHKKLRGSREVDDVFQQIFLKLHRARSQYDPKYLFEQWLFVIARSVLLDYLKQKKRSGTHLVDSDPIEMEQIADPKSHSSDVSSYSSASDVASFEHLSDEQRQVVQLRVLDELTYREISKRLKRSEASVRQIFSRAVKKLRSLGLTGKEAVK